MLRCCGATVLCSVLLCSAATGRRVWGVGGSPSNVVFAEECRLSAVKPGALQEHKTETTRNRIPKRDAQKKLRASSTDLPREGCGAADLRKHGGGAEHHDGPRAVRQGQGRQDPPGGPRATTAHRRAAAVAHVQHELPPPPPPFHHRDRHTHHGSATLPKPRRAALRGARATPTHTRPSPVCFPAAAAVADWCRRDRVRANQKPGRW